MSLLLHALQRLADRQVPAIVPQAARVSVRPEVAPEPVADATPAAVEVMVEFPSLDVLGDYEPVEYVEASSSYDAHYTEAPELTESVEMPAVAALAVVEELVDEALGTTAQPEAAEVAPAAAEPRKESAPHYFKPIAVSGDVAQVRDVVLRQLAAKETRVIGLAHADRAGEASAVAAELAKAMVGFLPGEVLVVDAKNQGEGWSDKLGCERSPGAEELFLGLSDLETVARPTSWPGLHAVPAGPHWREIQLTRSSDIDHALAACRRSYPLVVLDLGCVDDTHVAPIARRCDATFLVVRLGETPRDQAQTALDRLQYAGVGPLSCILTQAS